MKYTYKEFEKALVLLNIRLKQNKASHYGLIVCGGSALIATNLIQRVTKDVDVVALFDKNNGPSRGDGGLFRLGLPDGLIARCICKNYGECLIVFFISRLDQIHFKLYASVDQFGGYHADDLAQLKPTDDELIQAARWSMSHDPSEGYKQSLILFFKEAGYANVIERF